MNVSTDNTSVSCSGWIVNGQTCTFDVSTISEDCGFISESVNESISLMVSNKHLIVSIFCIIMYTFCSASHTQTPHGKV